MNPVLPQGIHDSQPSNSQPSQMPHYPMPQSQVPPPAAYHNPNMYKKSVMPPMPAGYAMNKKRKITQNQPQKPLYQPYSPYIIPQHPPARPEPSQLIGNLQKLREDELDIFYRLMDIPARKTPDQRMQAFLELVNELSTHIAAAQQILCNIINLISTQEHVKHNIKNPFVPLIFQPVRNVRPSFYMLIKAKNGIEYQIQVQKKIGDVILASFISLDNNNPGFASHIKGNVKMENKDVPTLSYGENEECYLLFGSDQMINKITTVRIKANTSPDIQMNPICTFLVIQMVTRRTQKEIYEILCRNKKVSSGASVIGDILPCIHPPSCRIDLTYLVDTTFTTGHGNCPRCGEPIKFSDLEFDAKINSGDISDKIGDETPEMISGRLAIGDLIASEMNIPSSKEIRNDDWLEPLTPDYREIVFGSTEEYLLSLQQFDE